MAHRPRLALKAEDPMATDQNTFANNPLDRMSERRTDAAWVAAQYAHGETLIVPFWLWRPSGTPPWRRRLSRTQFKGAHV